MERVKTIATIGNYLPRMCCIATFTTDLVISIKHTGNDLECFSVAKNDRLLRYRYPGVVRFDINQNKFNESYLFVAQLPKMMER